MWLRHPIAEIAMLGFTLLVATSNLAFIAAAILLPLRKRRAALVCAVLAN